jgi:hypothetical protein
LTFFKVEGGDFLVSRQVFQGNILEFCNAPAGDETEVYGNHILKIA